MGTNEAIGMLQFWLNELDCKMINKKNIKKKFHLDVIK